MRGNNEERALGFMKDPFADASHKNLIHRASSMRRPAATSHRDIQQGNPERQLAALKRTWDESLIAGKSYIQLISKLDRAVGFS